MTAELTIKEMVRNTLATVRGNVAVNRALVHSLVNQNYDKKLTREQITGAMSELSYVEKSRSTIKVRGRRVPR
jgi:hypothetical protein